MNHLLAILIILLASSLLIVQSLVRTPEDLSIHGTIVAVEGHVELLRGETVREATIGDELRRGEVVKTGEGWAVVTYGGTHIALANNTEIGLTSPGMFRLLGGRIMSSGPSIITTPWITARADEQTSVVNYAWKREVQILPIEASTLVENAFVASQELLTPATWIEETKKLSVFEEPFTPESSSESEFYAWALHLLKEAIPSDDGIK